MITVKREDRLGPDQVAEVLDLARAAGDVDGAYPLSEHTVLHLRHGGDRRSVHLLVLDPAGAVAGYAHVDTTDEVDGAAAELFVGPAYRRGGRGHALVTAALAAAAEHDPAGRLRLWAHGDHPSANALALSHGFTRERVLWQMRRSLFAELPEPALPEGVSIRAFRPGQDDRPWLALNARAFAGHPEQGRWTEHDLRVRMSERWFDPDGFLLAERGPEPGRHSPPGGELVGFHWTKVHGGVRGGPGGSAHQHDPIGEVYVLGVDPRAHGLGLGRVLTLAGLRHLRARGLDQVMLYVDEDNRPAVRLYQSLGFARWATDVLFQKRVPRDG